MRLTISMLRLSRESSKDPWKHGTLPVLRMMSSSPSAPRNERFVSLTRQIRQLEQECDALKDTITEALQHEPPSEDGQQYVDFDGYRVELGSRPRYAYSDEVRQLEKQLLQMKARERQTGAAEVESMNFHVRCSAHRTTSEEEARERKASRIAAYLASSGFTQADVASWVQAERDAVARRAGQRSPSEKTWGLVLTKLKTSKNAA